MVAKNVDYSKMSSLDGTLGNLKSLEIKGSKAVIDKYVELKNRKLANELITFNNVDVAIIRKAKMIIISLVEKSVIFLLSDTNKMKIMERVIVIY